MGKRRRTIRAHEATDAQRHALVDGLSGVFGWVRVHRRRDRRSSLPALYRRRAQGGDRAYARDGEGRDRCVCRQAAEALFQYCDEAPDLPDRDGWQPEVAAAIAWADKLSPGGRT